jgi:Bacterial Ig-like domain (group 2).
MSATKNTIQYEKDDRGLKVHKAGVIAQLCAPFRSHEQGLPEWFKNASAEYARQNAAAEHRVLTLIFGSRPSDDLPFIALLDHGGMTVQALEEKFADWGNPEAHLGETESQEVIEGGHGNGGKCYMTQMFEHSSYLHTVHAGRSSRYGFVGNDPHPCYFPDKARGRGVPVASAKDELMRALAEIGIKFSALPDDVLSAAAQRDGFTLIVGVKPKNFLGKDAWRKLVEDALIHHPQMVYTTQTNRIYVLHAGRKVHDLCPIVLPEIEPHPFAAQPRIVQVPDEIEDPVSGESCEMNPPGAPKGRLILRTAAVSMRWKKKGRHHIRYMAHGRPVGFLAMEDVSRSDWVDRMYGECQLDQLSTFETNDRMRLADSPVTRALDRWIRSQIIEYENEFKKREKVEASQEEKNKLQELNQLLDAWKNKFLDDSDFHAGSIEGEGPSPYRPKPQPLPSTRPVAIHVRCPYQKAGIGVWLRLMPEFIDAAGRRVGAPGYIWHSSDWAVATVDSNHTVVTHTPGPVQLWVETTDGSLRSDPVSIQVIDTVKAEIEPRSIEAQAGRFQQLEVKVTDRDGTVHEDVLMTWTQDDSSIVSITYTGKIIGRKAGSTTVYAMDEHCMDAPAACHVTIIPAETGPGDSSGKAYPRILLSDVDPDPLNPDKEPYTLSPGDGPVHQPTPQHVDHNIWFINLQCPLAKLYFEHYGPESREWRSYHIERYIEALAKIRLALDFQREEHLPFDEVERRWREIASEVQRRALAELRPLLEGQDLVQK